MTRTTLLRTVAVLSAGAGLCFATGLVNAQPDPLTPPANGPRKADPTWHALCNATVHVKPGQTLQHATVVVRNGRIVSVEGTPAKPDAPKPATPPTAPTPPAGTPPAPKDDISMAPGAPPGARVWDCTGLHLYSGFIDPFVEVDVPALPSDAPGQHWNSRVTPQRSALEARGPDASTAEALRKLGFTAAAITPRGGIFRGSAALVSLAAPEDDRSLARPPVYAENVFQTVALDTGGGGGRRGGGNPNNPNSPGTPATPDAGNWPSYPSSQMGVIALIRQTFSDADWQAAARTSGTLKDEVNCLDSIAPAPAQASAANAHAPVYVFNTEDELESFRALKIAEEFNRPTVLLGCGNEFRRLDGIVEDCKSAPAAIRPQAAASVPLIIPLNFPEPPRVGTIGQAESVELRDLMTWEQAPTNPRRLVNAGLDVSLTTAKLRDRSRFRDNLRKAIAYGLTEDQALAMITTSPAHLLHVEQDMGTIEKGRLANLVVADGSIFVKKTQLRDVWVDGKRHELNAAPSNLKGEWAVTIDPLPKLPDGATFRLTYSIDKDNALTIRKFTRDTAGAEEKIAKATARNVRVETAGYGVSSTPTRLSFVLDHEPLGEPGVFTIAGVVEGDTIIGDGIRASGDRFRWTAKRTAPEPATDPEEQGRALVGTWNLIEFEGHAIDAQDPAAAERPALVIERGNTATLKEGDKQSKAESVKITGTTLEATFPGEPLGEKAPITIKGDVKNDALVVTHQVGQGELHDAKFQRAARPEGRRGDRRPDTAAADKSADPVTGNWSGTATSSQMPQGLPVSYKFKLEGTAVTGSASSQFGTVDINDGKFEKAGTDAGKLTFAITVPDAGVFTFNFDVANNSLKGTGAGGPMQFNITATRSGSAAVAAAGADEDEEVPTDIPEKFGYPFGPYAMDTLPAQEDVVFEHATIWTSGPAGVIADGSIRVKDGKILWIADNSKNGSFKVDPNTKVIDAKGKHITAGLIDCHSHTGISRGVNEGGQAVTAEVRIQDVTDPDSMNWYWELAGGLTCVNNLHGSANPIGGQNCVNKIRWGVRTPDEMHLDGAMPGIKFALGENVKRSNSSGLDTGPTRYPNTRMGVETLFRDRFTAAREYSAALKRGEHPRRDLELEALAEILDGKRLIHCHSYRQDEILALCRVADEFGFKLGTFQHILEGYKVADEVRDHSGGGSCFSDWWAYKVEVQDAIPYDGAIMHDVGVTVSFNSDSDELARRMNVEAGKAVKYGNLDPAEALKFLTINPAKQLRIDDKVGSLEVGKDADFAVWSVPAFSSAANQLAGTAGNSTPFPNPAAAPANGDHYTVDGTPLSTMARCEQTWIDGRCYFSTERDSEMRTKNSAERNRITQKLLASGNRRGGGAGGDARPGGPPGGPPGGGPPGGRRRRPTDDQTAGAMLFDDDQPEAPTSLLQAMIQRAADQRREFFLQLWRMGIDPSHARCGDCGESMIGGAR